MIKALNNSPILKASILIGLITLAAKFLGYIEKVILAYYFGTSYQVDIYNVVVAIIMAVFVFFREITEPGFLNVFLKSLTGGDTKRAWALFNKIARYILIVTSGLAVVAFFFPHAIIDLFAPGFGGEKRALAVHIIQAAFPATIFLSLSTLTNITLNGLKQFVLPAFGDLAFKIVILLCLIVFFKYAGIYSIVYGVIAGAFIKVVIHSVGLYKYYSLKKLTLGTGYMQQIWRLTWPLILGVTFSQISALVDNIFASYMKEGTLSALSYSKKIIELPILIFPYILSMVVFPYFSELAILKEKAKLSMMFLKSTYSIIVVFLPLSVFFYIFSYDIIELFLKRGAFGEQSTLLTAKPFACYSLGLIFFSVETVLVIFFYANSNTKTPIFVGMLCVVENIALAYLLINKLDYIGIALAHVISKATKVVILSWLIRSSLTIHYRSVTILILKVFFSATVLAVMLLATKYAMEGFAFTTIKKAIFLAGIFFVGAACYTLTLFLLRFNMRVSSDHLVLKK